MGDYSFGPSATGWTVIFWLAVIGAAALLIGALVLVFYLIQHLHWVS